MLVTVSWIYKNYNRFNELYFGNMLPNIDFKISRSKKTWGYASYKFDYPNDTVIPCEIVISNYFDSPEEVKLNTLLHEMIHIADYTFNPQHFIRNHKPVHGRSYDAHGWWFRKECERMKEYGWDIQKYVSEEAKQISSLSANSIRCLNNKKANCLACVIKSENLAYVFKTDINKIRDINNTINRIGLWQWKLYLNGEHISVEFYKTNNEKFALRRSCCTKITGGSRILTSSLKNYLDRYECTEYKIAA